MRPHRHVRPYVALVIRGTYIESSFDGRFACSPGCLVTHPAYHEHMNEFGGEPCLVLNLPITELNADVAGYRLARTPDPAALIKLAHRNLRAACMAVDEELRACAPIAPPGWLSHFLERVSGEMTVRDAARACGVTPEHASRVARSWFGVSPVRLRREGRLRRAVSALRSGASPAEAAVDAGFSDQPHLTRVLKAATGLTPARLRRP